MKNPKAKMWLALAVSFTLIGLTLFLGAGTADYWRAWVYLAVGVVSRILLTLYLIRDPILLENRTRGGPVAEQRPAQKIIVMCAGISAIAVFVVPALDRRFRWSNVPSWLSITGDLLIIVAMRMVFLVFKENSFGARAVEMVEDQRVISTGPYAVVRHPMYASAAVYFIGVSLALGSYWGLIPAVLTIFSFVWRLFDEEKFLAQNLPGYAEYCAKLRWRLIPKLF